MPAPVAAVCVAVRALLYNHARVAYDTAAHAQAASSIVTGTLENSDRPLALWCTLSSCTHVSGLHVPTVCVTLGSIEEQAHLDGGAGTTSLCRYVAAEARLCACRPPMHGDRDALRMHAVCTMAEHAL